MKTTVFHQFNDVDVLRNENIIRTTDEICDAGIKYRYGSVLGGNKIVADSNKIKLTMSLSDFVVYLGQYNDAVGILIVARINEQIVDITSGYSINAFVSDSTGNIIPNALMSPSNNPHGLKINIDQAFLPGMDPSDEYRQFTVTVTNINDPEITSTILFTLSEISNKQPDI